MVFFSDLLDFVVLILNSACLWGFGDFGILGCGLLILVVLGGKSRHLGLA